MDRFERFSVESNAVPTRPSSSGVRIAERVRIERTGEVAPLSQISKVRVFLPPSESRLASLARAGGRNGLILSPGIRSRPYV